MNAKVRSGLHLRGAQASLMAVTYYLAYIPTSLFVAGALIRRGGYRITFVLGLGLFGVGNFVVSEGAAFAVKGDEGIGYAVMVVGMFVVGSGISTLERAANTYVVRCGERRWSSVRLNLAQSAAAVGTVVAPLLAAAVIFAGEEEGSTDGVVVRRAEPGAGRHAMASVVSLYRICGGAVLGLAALCALLFFRTELVPEVVAANLHVVEDGSEEETRRVGWFRRVKNHPLWKEDRLWYASVANFFNLGCQVAVAQFMIGYCQQVAGMKHAKGAHMLSIAQSVFVVGRLVMALACRFMKARKVLLFFILGALTTTTAAAFAPGLFGVACAISIMFFEGPLFPTIFATADVVEDQYSSRREDIVIASISGGAVLSPLVGALSDGIATRRSDNKGDALAFTLISAGFTIVASYIVTINGKKSYKKVIDEACNDKKELDIELGRPDSTNKTQETSQESTKTLQEVHIRPLNS